MKQFQDDKNLPIVRSQSIPTSKNTDKLTVAKVIRAKLANDRHQQSEAISINNSKISQTLPIRKSAFWGTKNQWTPDSETSDTMDPGHKKHLGS
uniref:Uncharacterized protein n=1 Tax=Acrobeloides nanus TaxID=290746 RepID=A0A914CVF3_9BILA